MASRAPGVRLAFGSQQGARARETDAPAASLFATSASRGVVDRLVVANVGRDYRDLANAGKAQIDAARPTTRPAKSESMAGARLPCLARKSSTAGLRML